MPSVPDNSHPAAPLLRVLQGGVLEALERDTRAHFGVARAKRKQLVLPDGVAAVPLILRGKRLAARNTNPFERAVLLSARWPDDGMQELRIPKIVIVARGWAGLRAGNYVLQCPTNTVVFLPPGVPQTDSTIWKPCRPKSKAVRCSGSRR